MHKSSLFGLAAASLAAIALVQPAQAAEMRAFSTEAFAAAQEEGRSILVDVYAPWCPVCARQKPIIESMAQDPANEELVIFTLDFDEQKAEQRALNVQRQSTLIAFDGKRETGRVVGETDPEKIAELIASTRS